MSYGIKRPCTGRVLMDVLTLSELLWVETRIGTRSRVIEVGLGLKNIGLNEGKLEKRSAKNEKRG